MVTLLDTTTLQKNYFFYCKLVKTNMGRKNISQPIFQANLVYDHVLDQYVKVCEYKEREKKEVI